MSGRTEALVDAEGVPAARPDSDSRAPQRPSSVPGALIASAVFLVAEAVLMGVIRLWQPRFFYIDDKISQYIPVWGWLGRQPGLALPVIDPDQGSAGNFVGDPQYGVLDPFHWLLATAIGHANGLNAVGWGLQVLAVSVLGLGIVALARHYGVQPLWAAAAALGAANSGFLLWYGATWWPAMWGTAVLPWLWWALVTRARLGVLAAALAAYLVASSGYPYSLPFAALIVIAVALERARHRRSLRAVLEREFVLRAAGAAGGLLLAAPGLLAASAMTPFSQRAGEKLGPLGSTGDFVPNLLDVLVGGPTVTPVVPGWWGSVMPYAVMATGWFAYPVLVLMDWRRFKTFRQVIEAPGVLVSLLLIIGSLVATQLPTVVGGLRFPFRYVVILQVVFPFVAALLVSRTRLRFTRRRLTIAAGVLLLQGLLGVSRTPELSGWHIAVSVAGILVLVAAGWVAHREGDAPDAKARNRDGAQVAHTRVVALFLLATVLAPLASIGASVGANDLFAEDAGSHSVGTTANQPFSGDFWPADVATFRARAVQPGLNATVLVWGGAGPDRGMSSGVPVGSAALFSDMRIGFGYTSVGQGAWANRWCQDYLGQSATCDDAVSRLLATVPGTDRTWLDVTSKDVLLIDTKSPPEIYHSLAGRWRPAGRQGGFDRFERITPTPGRITVTGDAVTSLRARSVGLSSETYDVSWSGTGDHRLITRIPWWPGYWASLNGRNLPIRALDGTAVTVDLPAGAGHGQLRIYFQPPGHRAALAAIALGAVLTIGAALLDLRRRSRRAL